MKKLFLLLTLLLSTPFIIVSCSKSKNTLYIYNWSNYIDPELLNKFEKDYNCKIVMDYFDSNEAMYAKLKVASPGYDLIIPSSYMASIMYKQKMIINLDKAKISNIKFIESKYLEKTEDTEMQYSIPYAISFTGLGYNKKRTPDLKPTWDVFGDKKYYHQISMFNDMRESIGAALKYLGYSLNSTNDKQLADAKQLIIEWKKNLAAYQNEEAKTSLADGILQVIQIYNGNIIQMQSDIPEMDFLIPEEGTSIGLDVLVIPSDSENRELAYSFINFVYEPENCVKNMKYIAYLCPNTKAMELVDKDLLKKITISDELFQKSEIIKDLGHKNAKYVKMWDEIKAY